MATPWRDELALARQAAGLPGFLWRSRARRRAAAATAAHVAERVAGREAAFLGAARRLIFAVPRSPYRQLLAWAGCEAGDLANAVAADGLEAALARLRQAGVYVTPDELRGRAPLRRPGLELAVAAADFDNPRLARGGGGGVAGATSGSTGAGRLPVRYTWRFLAEEAATEHLLLGSHGLDGAATRLAFWLPGPPGIAGLHNLLVHARLGNPPRRWFSPTPPPRSADGLAYRAERAWSLARRLLPGLGPAVELVPLDRAADVARWLAAAPRPVALKCFASAAARVAAAALDAGLDIAGTVIFAGGEPLTAPRRALLARAGVRVFGRYAATEAGFIAGECPAAAPGGGSGSDGSGDGDGGKGDGGAMHLYADRLAVVGGGAVPLAFTSLSLAAPKVLLNVELGDHGTLHEAPCDCPLGRAGLTRRVSDVSSPAKLAAEGVKLGALDFARLVESAMAALGGDPDAFQIQLLAPAAAELDGTGSAATAESRAASVGAAAAAVSIAGSVGSAGTAAGGVRIRIALAPHSAIPPAALRARLAETLPTLPGGALAARLWFAGGALTVDRQALLAGPGGKMQRVVHLTGIPSPRQGHAPTAAALPLPATTDHRGDPAREEPERQVDDAP